MYLSMNYYFLIPIIINDCGLKGNFQEPIMTDEKKKHVEVKSISHRAEAERHPQASLSLLQLWHMGFNVCNTKSSKKGEKPLLHLKKKEKCPLCTRLSPAIIGNLGIKTNSSCRSISSEKIGHQVTSSRFVVIDYYFIRKYNSLNIKFVNIS